jgi:CRP-like cAMP-binding protein
VESFKSFLKEHISVTQEDWDYIKERLHRESCKKDSILTNQGQLEDRVYFLLSGITRLYYEAEVKDTTLNIGFPNNFVSAYSSFLSRKPSEFILHTLTDCEYIYFSHSDLEDLYANTSCGQELGRIFAEELFLYLSKRENDFLLKSPTQRYLDLFEEQPRLIQEVPQKYLASYIGITPQALSRIRAKL